MDFSNLLNGFVNDVPCMSCLLPKKIKLKFDQEFKVVEAYAQT